VAEQAGFETSVPTIRAHAINGLAVRSGAGQTDRLLQPIRTIVNAVLSGAARARGYRRVCCRGRAIVASGRRARPDKQHFAKRSPPLEDPQGPKLLTCDRMPGRRQRGNPALEPSEAIA
jgi:hypothetical protein